jgi:hypothetical protein
MSLKTTLLAGAILFVGGITFLHVFVNEGELPFFTRSADGVLRFRVGFLPVT